MLSSGHGMRYGRKMAGTVRIVESIGQLRRSSDAWNDLWSRSSVARPTARAEQLAIWYDCFAHEKPFRAVVIERDGQLVGALPFVLSRRWGVPFASSLGNSWSPGGELLLDHTADTRAACTALVEGLQQQLPGLLSVDGLLYESDSNRALLNALET